MKNISNISFNKIHYYAYLQFNILYYNRSITAVSYTHLTLPTILRV